MKVKKFCSYCSKSFPFSSGTRLKKDKLFKTFHKTCAKKLLKEDSGWQLLIPSENQ